MQADVLIIDEAKCVDEHIANLNKLFHQLFINCLVCADATQVLVDHFYHNPSEYVIVLL